MKPDDFIQRIFPAAKEGMLQAGIPASFTIAQAALESSWGESKLARRGFNLFGIKADKSWKGETLEIPTIEYINGVPVTQVAKWRRYSSWADSLLDHVRFLQTNPRYAPCFAGPSSGEEFARRVAACGYATDPKYADKIGQIIRGRNLSRFDI